MDLGILCKGWRLSSVSGKWIQPKCVPECLVLHLETFVWKRYKWRQEDEKELATYILQNSRCLKKAIFSTNNPEKLEKLGKRREMLNELTCVVRASSNPSDHHLSFYYAVLAIANLSFWDIQIKFKEQEVWKTHKAGSEKSFSFLMKVEIGFLNSNVFLDEWKTSSIIIILIWIGRLTFPFVTITSNLWNYPN